MHEKVKQRRPPWCGIVFAERKMSVYALQRLLSTCPCLDFLRCAALMGAGGSLAAMAPTVKVCISSFLCWIFPEAAGGWGCILYLNVPMVCRLVG